MRKALIIAGSIAATVLAAAALMMGSVLSAPALRSVGNAPPDLNAQDVSFDGVKGWFVAAGNDAPCVLLMHGVRADRRSMIQRARVLREAGYSSLLIDLQAHGESPGRHITFGHLESANARAAVLVLRERLHCRKVAAIGQSLGGAAALLGEQPLEVDALVLESVYPTIEEAVADRLRIRLGGAGALLTPILLMQLKPRLGVSAGDLKPIRYIGDFRGPLLIAGGEKDKHTTPAETRRLYAAANGPKQLWIVPGAAHVDLQRFAPTAYSQRVIAFLKTHVLTSDAAPRPEHATAQQTPTLLTNGSGGDLPPRKSQGALTNAEWRAYRDEVERLSDTRIENDAQSESFQVSTDELMLLYVFTKPTHPAHPCAVRFAFRPDAPPEAPEVAIEAHHARSRHDCYPWATRTVQGVMAGFRDGGSLTRKEPGALATR